MTLKEKFAKATNNGSYYVIPIVEDAEIIEKVADDFAIGFAEWFTQQQKVKIIKKIGLFNCYMKMTSKELLEIYKDEKGL